jgi:hypothetical protein
MGPDLLLRALVAIDSVASLSPPDWDILVRQARRVSLLARVTALLEERNLLDKVPAFARLQLESARAVANNEERILRWEVNRINRALSDSDVTVVLLKGAAYVFADLPVARGRLSSDVDILVPRKQLRNVEERLVKHGWQHVKLEDYDQYYYRTWAHELPPLQHRERKTIVDVHHTILPLTGRLHPDPEKLLQSAVPVDGTRFKVLAPADMVLHSAAHAFQDGDLQRGLRDVVDLDDLFRHFGRNREFWDTVAGRAEEIDLARPLYYALRYARKICKTPIPEKTLERSRRWQPPWPLCAMMDKLVSGALAPRELDGSRSINSVCRWLLYVRSHWLRMSPWLLAKHLLRQSRRRFLRKSA